MIQPFILIYGIIGEYHTPCWEFLLNQPDIEKNLGRMCWEYHGADRISSCFLSTIFALRAVCMVAVANHPKLYIYHFSVETNGFGDSPFQEAEFWLLQLLVPSFFHASLQVLNERPPSFQGTTCSSKLN